MRRQKAVENQLYSVVISVMYQFVKTARVGVDFIVLNGVINN